MRKKSDDFIRRSLYYGFPLVALKRVYNVEKMDCNSLFQEGYQVTHIIIEALSVLTGLPFNPIVFVW